jgi:putative tryptophan/tyrosine transport system substrate-binding protein
MIARREFITLLGGAAAAWPLAVRAQQALPVIGFLHFASSDGNPDRLRAFREGLKEAGFAEGENVAIEYRWAENQVDRLPMLAADLVRRRVAVISAISIPAAFAAKAATVTLPIVFVATEDPVKLGLVASLARPQGNLTGINFFASELAAKRLELLLELVPGATRVAVLVEPGNSEGTASTLRDVEAAARGTRLQIQAFNTSSSSDIDAAFEGFVRERPDALLVANAPFFTDRRVQLALLAALHRLPAIYPWREFVEAGGLISYGASLRDAYRQVGVYTGRILKGAKPADLPVVQSTKFELVINHQTARILNLTVPPTLLATADEVIE